MRSTRRVRGWSRSVRSMMWLAVLAAGLLALAACSPGPSPAEAPMATEAAVEEPAAAEMPAEEPAATEMPAEEPAATEMPAEEPEATEMPAEEPAATEMPVEEPAATEMPAEEPAGAMQGDPAAGELVLAAAVGCGCHFNGDLGALAGGNKFEGDFGVVHSRNLTPDLATGIAGLGDQELADAIRYGKRPGGGNLFIMPRYSGMADEDVYNLIAYLRSLEPVENPIPDRDLAFEPPAYEGEMAAPAVAPTDPVERGAYLASLARCSMCHTPLDENGSPIEGMMLAGAPFRDTVAPNLTPDEATGLGLWSEEEIAAFLATGLYDDGMEPHAAMKQVADRGTSRLTDADRLAIAAFLKSLPPVENLPAPPQ